MLVVCVPRSTHFLLRHRLVARGLGSLDGNPLLASLPAVGLAPPQLLWCLDFLTGARISGMTSYMFDGKYSLFVRGLSSFHGWLPFLLLWMVWRLGYDRRALLGWTVVSSCVLLASFFLAPAPPAPADNPNLAVNLNYVHGLSYDKPQTVMPPWLWLGIMLVGFPVSLLSSDSPGTFGMVSQAKERGAGQ